MNFGLNFVLQISKSKRHVEVLIPKHQNAILCNRVFMEVIKLRLSSGRP